MARSLHLIATQQGKQFYCRFHHPVRGKVVCICLGDIDEHANNLAALFRIFRDEEFLHHPPGDTPFKIRCQWLKGNSHED